MFHLKGDRPSKSGKKCGSINPSPHGFAPPFHFFAFSHRKLPPNIVPPSKMFRNARKASRPRTAPAIRIRHSIRIRLCVSIISFFLSDCLFSQEYVLLFFETDCLFSQKYVLLFFETYCLFSQEYVLLFFETFVLSISLYQRLRKCQQQEKNETFFNFCSIFTAPLTIRLPAVTLTVLIHL